MRMSTIFSRGVTNNMLRAIYGERQIGLYLSAFVQAGDILMPQLPDFGGPKPVLVPVGADQDPHIRLSRDLADRYRTEFGFVPPSAIYHRLEFALTGGYKMSKRVPESGFTLDDTPTEASKRVRIAFTGGRDTTEEQRRLGGRADICPVYDLYQFHFAKDDEHVGRRSLRRVSQRESDSAGNANRKRRTLVKCVPREPSQEARFDVGGRQGTDDEEPANYLTSDREVMKDLSSSLHPIERRFSRPLASRRLAFHSIHW